MKFNKVYIPQDALRAHEDFDTWYADGERFVRFECKAGWKSEKDRVQIIGRMGGQVGEIKPDNYTLTYRIQYERYEYVLHTFVIGRHYFIDGMVWTLFGSYYEPPFDILEETLTSYRHKAVHVKLVDFKGHGKCYEVHVPDLSKLRIGVACVVAIGIKETWKGKSEGRDVKAPSLLGRLRNRIADNKGYTYEEVQEMIAADDPHVRIVKPTGRPIDDPKSHYKKRR